YLEKELHIRRPEDWYSVAYPDLARLNVPRRLFLNQDKFVQWLKEVYPNVNWEPEKMAWSSLGWSHFQAILAQLFPGEAIPLVNEVDRESAEMGPLSNRIIMIPKYKLSLEYQGPISYAKSIIEKQKTL